MDEESSVSVFGRSPTRSELRRRVGRLEQVAGIEPFALDDGPARGMRSLRGRTGSGLSFFVLLDRGVDLGGAGYGDVPLARLSPTGVVAPALREPEGEGWLRSFPGGLLVACGLHPGGTRRYRLDIRDWSTRSAEHE